MRRDHLLLAVLAALGLLATGCGGPSDDDDGFNTGDQVAEIYCRIGDDVITLAGETKPCTSPFER